ncbi:hypothetical protein [Bifidobacterium tissieri]|uniref:Uncharacterized protein n=1 Tax=Bifidobacterium tissieri TaxID=1630162 RepID=A0A5N0A1I6_9BIFI|nr:hypothetical protein [Bifidobacterium tissieri]KAA8828747.1 hypothetical protein EMO89_09030 [Bifidobacterium tissieri]KAA8833373.1 hypothetical protein EM849_01495 [Bifidobacterium tissieri]
MYNNDVDRNTQGDAPLPDRVILLTGAERLPRDLSAFCAENEKDVCVIRYRVERFEDANDVNAWGDICIVRSVQGCGLVPHGEERLPMRECCVTCAIKSDAERMVVGLGKAIRRCGVRSGVTFAVVLPIGLQAFPIARYMEDCFAFADDIGSHGEVVPTPRVSSVVSTVDEVGLRACLFDDASFSVRADGDDDATVDVSIADDRSVGEIQATLLREADRLLVFSVGSGETYVDCGLTWMEELIAQIRGGEDMSVERACDADWGVIAGGRYDADAAQQRLDALTLHADCGEASRVHEPVWLMCASDGFESTMVHSVRPIHPGRLSALLAGFGESGSAARVHIRGHFTVPTRPFSVFVWDGGPGGVSIEELDNADGDLPCMTVLQVVSENHTDIPLRLEWLLLTDEEMRVPAASWFDQTDEFTLWSVSGSR